MVGNKNDTHTRTIENPVIGDKVSFISTARETNNTFTLVQVELAPRGGNPLHYHKNYSETFHVLKGKLGLQLANQKMTLKEGECFTVNPLEVHCFFNPSATDPVLFEVKLEPGSAGFEKSLQVLYGLARDNKTNKKGIPKNLYDLSLFISWGDSHMPGILSLLEPIMRMLAKRAIKTGRDQELIRQYCTI